MSTGNGNQLTRTAPSQVKTFIAVLSIIHNLNGWKSPYKFESIKRTIKAIEKSRKKRDKVNPFPIEILAHHLDNVDNKNHRKWLRDALVVSICVRTTFRAETISALNINQVRFEKIRGKKFAIINVRKSKTNQSNESFLYYIDPNEENPSHYIVYLLSTHLLMCKKREEGSPLFWKEEGIRLSTNDVSLIVKEMTIKAESNLKLSSRSLRVGSVNWMISAGFSIENIKALGWSESSNAVNCYVRNSTVALKGAMNKMFKQASWQN
jgi:site-specific recombinase XerD